MIENIIDFINAAFMYYIFGYASIFFISTIYSIINLEEKVKRQEYDNNLTIKNDANYVPVSILVPAHNESLTILECIESLMALDYPEFEIIVIDDGSTDDTAKCVIDYYDLQKVVRPVRRVVKSSVEQSIYSVNKDGVSLSLVTKENGGKADALNLGINASKYPFFVGLDADSLLQKDSLKKIIEPVMEDDTTIAVGGNIKIANQVKFEKGVVKKTFLPKNFAVLMQMIEYSRIFITTRVWFNRFNGNLIISGAFGLFKKEAVINVGGYNSSSVGEDMLLVVNLHSFYRKNRLNYKIKYASDAICWSQVPNDWGSLAQQRRRWHTGLIQSLTEHKYIFLNHNYGLVGMFSYMYYLIYEMFSCVIEVLGILSIFIAYKFGYINYQFLITYIFVYVTFSFVISFASIILDNFVNKAKMNILQMGVLGFMSLLEGVGYRQFCSINRLISFLTYRKSKNEWGRVKRNKHNWSVQ